LSFARGLAEGPAGAVMDQEPIRILVIDDAENDFLLLRAQFGEVRAQRYELSWAATYDAGLERVLSGGHDVGLVDQRLGPASGVELIRTALARGCSIPLILLTGQHEYRVDVEAMQAGATDYLVKEEVQPALLERSVRYAIERRRLLAELERQRQREEQERELNLLSQLSQQDRTAVTARNYGVRSLREARPDEFNGHRDRFCQLMDLSLEEQGYKVTHRVSDKLRGLGEDLGAMGCGPRDVVELYTSAIRERLATAPQKKGKAFMEEGRIMALELMGHLASYYRRYCVFNAPQARQQGGGHA
jgi:FixJ family two-component response regulator